MSHTKLSCLALVVVLALSCSALAMPENRSYVAGNYHLVLDGVKCGFLKSVDGGAISAEVINEPAGPSYFVKKHIGQPKYQDFTLQVGFSMSKPIYDWIAESWRMNYQRKNGSVIVMDYTLTPKSERQFMQALITETTIPAMDGSSKEPAYMTVKFSPEIIRNVAASGNKAEYGEYGKNEQKVFLPSSFKLEIDGLDCSKVTKIDSFTVKQSVVSDDIGDARDSAKEPGKLEFPNLKITISEVIAESWIAWHKDFVIEGNNDESREKNGMLTLLSPNGQKALARIKFYNLGIFTLQPEKAEANADQIKKVEVELYVERMELLYGEDTGGTSPATAPTTPPAAPKGVRRG
jgi:phage tail-like protein